ncbi:zinc finger protein GAI-ASSOCIATED FACTOR 1-like [Vigna unguiculata]|uniref:zinc finger protein GAI-ASSOCIATED FACTOR 1-like n=1 Tax=Vigna unguiculata TaxID=3917 RepID=UPI001016FABC|nr:zinc finger protein GAI-ASSOCIATED FACTOR 1-like [Vigna unguiculata]XP_027940349.1 zinc finger protein GAI-ASSOCIATED FACTOR 1-like [Vigna unguiculata]XP_027940350.1 zinc finger protein GAI-ASSOCIATED FACTOR 1-like [Vigna unguiculata]XP_027940351.1 zinc finger protein GAI-ASSOCIATED FACTOR 1-like [Vigna unguiculata]XP_027940352.1 zinc finger protein GAI-ASSOCIATED FACTOR 1-like [Vigna unguiculata]
MSNLTSASSEISASSGIRNDNGFFHAHQYSSTSINQEPQPKKKRSLPGHPDPDAEVIALTPETLLATNRFVCEICQKGFQRDQNLQLHRRGHNLPWKLKKKNSKEVRKKVYVCPEASCVHHDPSRALGDLTGIKKHFFRKHGEKKWKCEKCSKRYAVQSDWKAHSKICGTREYKCDCGTLFSRRDSFITHRAFCDALAQESGRAVNPHSLLSSQSQFRSHGLQLEAPPSSSSLVMKREQDLNLLGQEIPSWLSSPTVLEQSLRTTLDFSTPHHSLFHHDQNPNPITTTTTSSSSTTTPSFLPSFSSFHYSTTSPHMSATALLQKASQIGVTVSAAAASQAMIVRPHLFLQQVHVPQCTTTTTTTTTTTGYNNMASSSPVSGMLMAIPSREQIGTHGFAS